MDRDHLDQRIEKLTYLLHSITKIDTRFIDAEGNIRFQTVIHRIPAVLHHLDDEYAYMLEVLKEYEPDHYYHYVNSYGLEYIAGGIWIDRLLYGGLLIGPLISSLSILDLVKDIIMGNQLPVEERRHLEHFYESLPILSDIEHQHLGELLAHLGVHHELNAKQIVTSSQERPKPSNIQKVMLDESKQLIEQRYVHQNELMTAITKGDREAVSQQLGFLMTELVVFSDRVPGSPIRSSKNLGFVLNTMCRIAAERGGVHPVYLHNISERFAIQIERVSSLPQLKKLFVSMAMEYCDLVNSMATGQYSPIVSKAVDYIQLNLGSPLLLKDIAEHVHVNPSHLSRKFKEETGLTINEFINRKRIEEAKLYLQRGNSSVTDVAFMVGFNDLNYFSKVFKRYTSKTPTQYAKRRNRT